MIRIERVPAERVLGELRGTVVAVHSRAHRRSPDAAPARELAERTLPAHAAREDFRFIAAFDERGELVGFVYGYTGHAGQWWHDRVAAAMDEETRTRWLRPRPFEVVELAVDPPCQGRGIGSRLLEAVLADLPHERALLSARRDDEPVRAFYRNRGWVDVVDEIRFGADYPPYAVLGRELAGRVSP